MVNSLACVTIQNIITELNKQIRFLEGTLRGNRLV
jgi:hypothetical protein